MVVCTRLNWSMNCWRAVRLWDHTTKMSSMNLSHKSGCGGYEYTCYLSNTDMNKFVYKGANLVPMAVPKT